MTRDEVIAMAREAGFGRNAFSQACAKHSNGSWVDVTEELERFAALVAAAEREAIAAEFDRRAEPGTGFYEPDEPAAIIRARGAP